MFSVGSVPRLYQEDQQDKPVCLQKSVESVCMQTDWFKSEAAVRLSVQVEDGRQRGPNCCKSLVMRKSLASKDMNIAVEEVTLLKAITRQLLRHGRLRKLSGGCSER